MYDEWDWELHARDERWREEAEDLREAMQDEALLAVTDVRWCRDCRRAEFACKCFAVRREEALAA